jgi:hypothetical protein
MSMVYRRVVLLVASAVLALSSFGSMAALADQDADDIPMAMEEECKKVAYGDHVLISYTTRYENQTSGPSIGATQQPFYVHIPASEDEMEGTGIFSKLVGLCESTTSNVHYDNLPDADARPIIRDGSEIYDLEESFDIDIHVQSVTTDSDYRIFEALRAANISMVLDLIEDHIGINGMDEYGQTPLMIAVGRQYLPVVAALLNTRRPKVDINSAKSSGFTALFYAVEKASPSILQALLRRGADPNMAVKSAGGKGNTPLHFACMLEKPKHAHLLLEYGANPYLKNEHDMIPYKMIPADSVPSARLQYKTMFGEVYKKLAAQESNLPSGSNQGGEL